VCCQRLEFLATARLHVPRCEILLPTSGARGTIRSGNFGQIATVLQSGGEEGMWTFDRYQRWMQQVTDWVRPPASAALRVQGEATPRAALPLRATARPASPRAAGSAAQPQPRVPLPATTSNPASRGSAPTEEVIEVPVEDMDLASLAELAKKVSERKS
jgi:twitching motility protein PilT